MLEQTEVFEALQGIPAGAAESQSSPLAGAPVGAVSELFLLEACGTGASNDGVGGCLALCWVDFNWVLFY